MSVRVVAERCVARSLPPRVRCVVDSVSPRCGRVTPIPTAPWNRRTTLCRGKVQSTNVRRQRALRPSARILGVVAFPVATAFGLPTAHASLGGNEISVADDAAEWNGVVHESVAEQYVVYEIESSSGSIVREYLTPEGRVFAVTWHGARLPDMRRLLGDYFDIFRTAERL